jgi:dolichol-phosphate mannosyltransferase
MSAPPRATVVVPTFNEADNMEPLCRRICAALPEVEIVVVDDASRDGTAARARELGKELPIRVIERVGERGLSTAVLRGFEEARTDVCVVIDADLSHPPELVPDLVRAVENGAEVAVGSRHVAGGEIDEWPLVRRLASRAGTLLARPLTSVSDPMSGFFCLRKSRLQGLDLKPRGFKILLEIVARAGWTRIVEVPIRFEDRREGTSKFGPKERREFLQQVAELYRDVNAWPFRVTKFCVTGGTGYFVHMAVLAAVVELLGASPFVGAIAGFMVAMTSNYRLNKVWTFRAKAAPFLPSYARYAVGAVGGLGVQLGIMHLLRHVHYLSGASLGILAGAAFTFLVSQFWAFAGKGARSKGAPA